MKIIISGAGEVGSHLAKMLRNEANDICVIDSNQQRLTALSETADVVTVCGNPASIEVLKNAGAEKADLFVAVNPSTSQNVNVVCSALAKSLGSKKVVCRVNNEEYLAYDNKYLFSDMGIDLLFYPEKIAAGEIVDLLKRSASTEAMEFGRGKLQISAGGGLPYHRQDPAGFQPRLRRRRNQVPRGGHCQGQRDHHSENRHTLPLPRPRIHHFPPRRKCTADGIPG